MELNTSKNHKIFDDDNFINKQNFSTQKLIDSNDLTLRKVKSNEFSSTQTRR